MAQFAPSAHEKRTLKRSYHRGRMASLKHPKSPDPILKRSFSTPNATKLDSEGVEDLHAPRTTAAEKKRNKLGYHRTSIACSHCRRRKIRCIASPDTPSRCVNCIRLKKECSFYPVDQQPGPETRAKVASRQNGHPSSSSTSSSSPAIGTGSPVDTPLSTLRSIISPPGSQRGQGDCFSDASGMNQVPESKAAIEKPPTRAFANVVFCSVSPNGISPGSHYAFTHAPHGWVPTDMTPIGVAKPDEMSLPWHAYPTEASMNGQFSPYTQTSSASVAWTSGTSETGSHDELAWGDFPNPIRSLSYSGESTDGHPHGPFMSLNQAHPTSSYERRQPNLSDVYSPYPTTVAGVPSHPMAVVNGGPTPVMNSTPFASGVNPWQHQHQILAAQGPHATWQYGGGSPSMLMDEQRMPGVVQAQSATFLSY
ncbi:hypothetical protein E4U31_001429 [Claviceps sp. LM219 group G6]|nr:hypothetical protein E4U31_001429 [Claviceps sp. LM219 group G6]